MFVLAYYGLLRIGKIAVSTYALKAKDLGVGVNKDKIMIMLFSSKTHDVHVLPQKIKISSTNASEFERNNLFCPFKIINRYRKLRGDYYHDAEQFFVSRDGTLVKAQQIRDTLKLALENLGLNSQLFDCHSFCAGRASQLIKLGYTVEQVKRIGRWKSNAVYKYIKL